LQCASPRPDHDRVPRLFREISWSDFTLLAEKHGVIAQVAGFLRGAYGHLVPAEIARDIHDLHRAQVLSSLKMTAELFRLADLFRAADLDFALVKGPGLATRAYGDVTGRTYGDLDFIVRQRDIGRATEVIAAAGYHPEVSVDSIRSGKIPGQYLFVRTVAPLLVELHTERTMRYFPRGLPIELFFSRRENVAMDGHDVPVLATDDELILICIHGAKHLWERLNLAADVAALVSRNPALDWDRTVRTAEQIRASRMLIVGLALARNLLSAPLPPGVHQRIEADSAAAGLAAQVAEWMPFAGQSPPRLLTRALYRVRMRGNAFAGLPYLLKLTFSPTQEDWGNPAGETAQRRFAAFKRPLRLARKYRGDKS
jgi:hypothetical protein